MYLWFSWGLKTNKHDWGDTTLSCFSLSRHPQLTITHITHACSAVTLPLGGSQSKQCKIYGLIVPDIYEQQQKHFKPSLWLRNPFEKHVSGDHHPKIYLKIDQCLKPPTNQNQ